jgi:hypothetical protein
MVLVSNGTPLSQKGDFTFDGMFLISQGTTLLTLWVYQECVARYLSTSQMQITEGS